MERLAKSSVNAFVNALIIWINKQAETDVPLTLDAIKAGIVQTAKKLFQITTEDETAMDMDSYEKGVKAGEMRKEVAMIAAMGKFGLTPEQAAQVVEFANHVWDSEKEEKRGR